MTARITITGNAATSPLVRITRTGRKVANFRIASNDRYQDRDTNEWVDGGSFYVGVACWGAMADNVEASVRSGMALVVTGKIAQRTYTDSEGKTQFAYEVSADGVGPDLSRGVADFTRTHRTSGRTISVDENGNPPTGVFDDPPGRSRPTPSRGPDDITVRETGGFGMPSGEELPPADDGSEAAERVPAELVGAAG